MWGWIILVGVLAGAAAEADPIQLQTPTRGLSAGRMSVPEEARRRSPTFSVLGNFGLGAGETASEDADSPGGRIAQVVGTTPANSQTNLNNAGFVGTANTTYSGAANATQISACSAWS